MLTVALTGGIGSGKSIASAFFAKLGVHVIDADVVSRELVTSGSPALKKICTLFGDEILLGNGELDRKKLGSIIFSNDTAKQQLESLLHPLILKRINNQQQQMTDAPYIILVVPLLIESMKTNYSYNFDRLLVIDSSLADQQRRSLQRDKSSLKEFNSIIASQSSRASRNALADDIILNNDTLTHIEKMVLNLHHQYLKVANSA